MKKIMIIAAVALMGYGVWNNTSPSSLELSALYEKPYIVVYGRYGSKPTRCLRKRLARRGIPFVFKSIDDQEVQDELHPRIMTSNLYDLQQGKEYYDLPVVDVSARLFERPSLDVVLEEYKKEPL